MEKRIADSATHIVVCRLRLILKGPARRPLRDDVDPSGPRFARS